jgi:hypothetical protein
MSYVSHPGTWLSRLTEGGVCRLAYREVLDWPMGTWRHARFKGSRVAWLGLPSRDEFRVWVSRQRAGTS